MDVSKHDTTLPSMLCLHGAGTSAQIFQCQASRIQQTLERRLNFVFIDGPFECQPGPGVLPFFADCGPFFSWECLQSLQSDRMANETLKLLTQTFEDCKDAGSEVVGLMGFSQGARVVAGILQSSGIEQFASLKFGVLLNATYPPMLISGHLQANARVYIPTIHVHGVFDEYLPQSRKLLGICFLKDISTLLELHIGHQLPSQRLDVDNLARNIIRLMIPGAFI